MHSACHVKITQKILAIFHSRRGEQYLRDNLVREGIPSLLDVEPSDHHSRHLASSIYGG